MSLPTPLKVSKPFGTKKKTVRYLSDFTGRCSGRNVTVSNWRTSRNVLGLQDIYSLTHFECKGYKYHFCYSSAGQDMRDTCQNTKEFSPHFKFPLGKKSVLSLKNKCSHLNREFGFVTHWETEVEQNTSSNTPTWAPQLASAAEERSQTEVVEMLEVKAEVSWQNWPYMETR